MLALLFGLSARQPPKSRSIPYSVFLEQVRQGAIDRVAIDQAEGTIEALRLNRSTFWSQGPRGELPQEDIKLLAVQGVRRDYEPSHSDVLGPLLVWLSPLVALAFFLWWKGVGSQGRRAGFLSQGQSWNAVRTTEKPKTTFSDIAGYSGVKEEIAEVVDSLRGAATFAAIGARIPKGMLLIGPPGTGKTLLARHVAEAAQVPFFSAAGSEFVEIFVGVGAARVRELFRTAREQAPAIIFFDEIDSIGRRRGVGFGGSHDEREQTLNQLLSEMDGFEAAEGVVVIAATNRPDVLDPALLRLGRFDRHILVPLPSETERRAILDLHCRGTPLAEDVDLDIVARSTAGMSGAGLANLVNEATLTAARRDADSVRMSDLESARERLIVGQRRDSLVLSDEERALVAYHEGGHALLAHLLPLADPLHKVTILPTGKALGWTQQLPVEARHVYRRSYIEDSLAVSFGGPVAEELVFGCRSTLARHDLVGGTLLARKLVQEWGLSERIGPMAWESPPAPSLKRNIGATRRFSKTTARIIDEEIKRMLRQQEDRARSELIRHRAGLEAVAQALIDRETLEHDEVARLIKEAGTAGHLPDATQSRHP